MAVKLGPRQLMAAAIGAMVVFFATSPRQDSRFDVVQHFTDAPATSTFSPRRDASPPSADDPHTEDSVKARAPATRVVTGRESPTAADQSSASADDDAPAAAAAPQRPGDRFPILTLCARRDIDDLWAEVSRIVASDREPWSPSETKRHMDAIFAFLQDDRAIQCLRTLFLRIVAQSPAGATPRAFLDLGSREIDSTKTFLKKFPKATSYEIHCFEANPKFNSLYPPFSQRHPNVHYYNFAVGIENTTLVLSDRSVGSSVLDGGKGAAAGAGGVEVPVIHFSEFLANFGVHGIRPGTFTVIKMDIEKMEFAVIHQMLRTGTILLFREFLLECHYNTNHPRSKRDPKIHIGRDDCIELTKLMSTVLPPLSSIPSKLRTGLERRDDAAVGALEAVLWNSPKTARKTGNGYMDRHGGFFPT